MKLTPVWQIPYLIFEFGTVAELLHYKKSNLQEIPLVSSLNDLPMIEEGATECTYPTVQPISTQGLLIVKFNLHF